MTRCRALQPAYAGPVHGGSILILALWTLFLLAVLAVAVGSHVSAGLNVARDVRRTVLAGLAARAGVERAVMIALQSTNAVGLTDETWNNDARYFSGRFDLPDGSEVGYRVVYRFVADDGGVATNTGILCEDARVHLGMLSNRENRALVGSLLERVGGLDDEAAEALVAAMVDWCDDDEEALEGELTAGAESDYYRSLTRPYSCHNGRFESLHELLLVRGMTEDIFDRIRPYVTVYGSDERININTAAPIVLLCVADASEVDPAEAGEIVSEIVNARPQEGLEDFDVLNSAAGAGMKRLLTVEAKAFRGASEAWLDSSESMDRRVTFVFDAEARGMLYWKEE